MRTLIIFLFLISSSLTLRSFNDHHGRQGRSHGNPDHQDLLIRENQRFHENENLNQDPLPDPDKEDILLKEEQHSEEEIESSDNHSCPQNILNLDKQKYQYAEIIHQGSLWTDESFKKEKALAGTSLSFTRASSKMSKVRLFGEQGISAGDVGQGSLANCYMLGAIASLAEHPSYLKSIFLNGDNAAGIYSTLWWIGLKPVVVTVDDYFPTRGEGGSWAYARIRGDSEIWPMVLEKSWAKIAGNYKNTEGGNTSRALHALTGAPVHGNFNYRLSEQALFNLMEEADKNKFYMGALTGKQSCGIVNYHAYTPISVFRDVQASDGNSYNLVQVRNPWAVNKWKGDFSKNSQLWTDELKKKFKVGQESGTFFMKIADYKKCVQYTSFAQVREGYSHTFKEFKDVTKVVVKRFTKLTKETFAVMVDVGCSVSAKSVYYKLYRIQNSRTFIASASGRYSSITTDGEVGEYEIEVEVEWNANYSRSVVINVYSSETDILFKDIPQDENTCTKVDTKLSNGRPWHLSGSRYKAYNCRWFGSRSNYCSRFGTRKRNEGMVANDACVVCGGGSCSQ